MQSIWVRKMTDDEYRRATDMRLNALETHMQIEGIHRGNVEGRLASIEDTLKWLVRLIFGALVLAVVGFIINGGLIIG